MADVDTDESDSMVKAVAAVIAGEFGYVLSDQEECYDRAYWMRLAEKALAAARTGAMPCQDCNGRGYVTQITDNGGSREHGTSGSTMTRLTCASCGATGKQPPAAKS